MIFTHALSVPDRSVRTPSRGPVGDSVVEGSLISIHREGRRGRRPDLNYLGHLGTVFNALTNRRDPTSGLTAPILKALGISLVPVSLIFLGTQLPGLQTGLMTTSLTGPQWLACIGLAMTLPLVIEGNKWIRRRRAPQAPVTDAQRTVNPARALTGAAP